MTEATPVDDDAVAGMVGAIRPDWSVETVERSDHGTDFVAFLDLRTPEGPREAVLKATTAGLVDPAVARAEPRLLELVGRETDVPVPAVIGYRDEDPIHPAPFVLLERVDGENVEGRPRELPPAVRECVVREAGANLASLHALGPLAGVGTIGVEEGDLAVLDTAEHPRYDDHRTWVLEGAEETLDALADGGFFPELADDPDRFADLVPRLRAHLRAVIPTLPPAAAPTYCHWDYRYGNLLVDPGTGETRAVLDWANLSAAEPAYNLAAVESHLFDPVVEDETLVAGLREPFRSAYADARPGWSFDDATRRRIETYLLVKRIDAMACLPLWLEDATPAARDEREADHRTFVGRYL